MQWSNFESVGEYPSERYGHGAFCIDETILVFGGKCSGTRDLQIWEVRLESGSPRWRRVKAHYDPQLRRLKKRWGFSYCYSQEFQGVLMHGGFDSEVNYSDTLFLSTRGCTQADFDNKLVWLSASIVYNRHSPSPRAYHSLIYLPKAEKAFLFGGQCCVGGPYEFYNDLYAFSYESGTWCMVSTAGRPPCPRSQHTAFVYNDCMYVFGGYTGNATLNDLFKFDVQTKTWECLETAGSKPPILDGLQPQNFRVFSSQQPGVLIKDRLIILSRSEDSTYQLYELNLNHLLWKKLNIREGPPSRGNATMTLVDDKLCVLGGHSKYLSDRNSGFDSIWCVILPKKLRWNCERLLWLACYKNDSSDCPMAMLPPEMIWQILTFINWGSYDI